MRSTFDGLAIKSLMPHTHNIYFRARDIRGTGADDEIRNCRTIANVMNNLSKLVFIFIISIAMLEVKLNV